MTHRKPKPVSVQAPSWSADFSSQQVTVGFSHWRAAVQSSMHRRLSGVTNWRLLNRSRQFSSLSLSLANCPLCMADSFQRTLYHKRKAKEQAISEEDIESRMRWDLPILSENAKCSVSLDLPIHNCKPTKACAEVCYACQGYQFFQKAIIKSLAVSRMIDHDPEQAARKMVAEAAGRAIRVSGAGEILPRHAKLLDYVEDLRGKWWGFTRRIDTHQALPRLMFSIDATSPESVMSYVREEVPAKRRAYLRRPGDPPAPLDVAVTFPVHGPQTRYVQIVPHHTTDCPATRKEVGGCWDCQRCY